MRAEWKTIAQPDRPQLPVTVGAKLAVKRADLQRLIDLLRGRGYRVIAPTIRDGAIIYDTVTDLDQLPVGWTDRQAAGEYRLERRDDAARVWLRSRAALLETVSASASRAVVAGTPY